MAEDGISPNVWAWTPTYHSDTYPAINPVNIKTLVGKSVLITAANKGLGRAMAISYAKAGASPIIITSRTGASETEAAILSAAAAAGHAVPTIVHLTLNVTSQPSVEAAAAAIREKVGRLDILVNNAGFMGPEAPLLEQPTEEYVETIDVNLTGVYRVTKAMLPLMLEGGLKIVAFLSSVGCQGVSCAGAYAISKFAIVRFCQFLNFQYGDQGVSSFHYHPGGVSTDLAQGLPEDFRKLLMDTPELAGDTMVWLTAEKRTWLNGRYISANWDMVELEGRKDVIVEKNLLKPRFDLDI
ncbi:hypothetical protein OQA88_1868 [Cercophora sp. LCS_1]